MTPKEANQNAISNKNDEFYTRIEHIEAEIFGHDDYRNVFRGKTVYCNCDRTDSAFIEFFKANFQRLGLKRLISTYYNPEKTTFRTEWYMKNQSLTRKVKALKGNGDFASDECLEILDASDVIVTNPPFTQQKDFITTLLSHNKQFLVIGTQMAASYEGIFSHIAEGEISFGYSIGQQKFNVPDTYTGRTYTDADGTRYIKKCDICWYTNLIHRQPERLKLTKHYTDNEPAYPHYENYDAIDCGSRKQIPDDYAGKMGVPISVLPYINRRQFDIIGIGYGKQGKAIGIGGEYTPVQKAQCRGLQAGNPWYMKDGRPKKPFTRLIIQKKQ